ncbi:MAG: WecB/TagA/CpsF family glycosyltransferase, partial [Leptospiraceae bacterium]|nr:WecB/TagA/CpsF family glycosyltransferase [Leptospiraceae bacterium]
PDIVFLGMDYPKQEIWIENNMSYLGSSVVIGSWNTFETLAGKIEKAPEYFHKNHLIWLWNLITKPWRILSLWKAFKFYLIIQWQAIKYKKKTNEL